MRGRHMPFPIGIFERNAWLHHMGNALNTVPEFSAHKQALNEFFEGFATFLINQPS
jgi:truncated hemoglobin YjbI